MFNKLYTISYDVGVTVKRRERINSRPVVAQGLVNGTKYIIARSKNAAIKELFKLYGEDQPIHIKEIEIMPLWKPVVVNKELYTSRFR